MALLDVLLWENSQKGNICGHLLSVNPKFLENGKTKELGGLVGVKNKNSFLKMGGPKLDNSTSSKVSLSNHLHLHDIHHLYCHHLHLIARYRWGCTSRGEGRRWRKTRREHRAQELGRGRK